MASSVFRAMLSDMFREGRELGSTNSLKLPLPDDDLDALRILLNMVHGHAYRLPHSVSFSTLANIAVLVDKYLLHEIAEVYCKSWIEWFSLKTEVKLSKPELVYRWLDICWVFARKKDFQKVTRLIQRNSRASSPTG